MTTDSELLRRYVDGGSEGAFREVVCRHIHVIYFTALRRTGGQTQLAEEIVQDVFSALATNARRLAGYSSLVGWLFVATRFAASKALRRERRRTRREQEAFHMQNDDHGGESVAEAWQQVRPAIDDLLDDLPERDRTAVLLRFFENRSFAELGLTFGISEDAARMRVDRALAKLADSLRRRGIVSTSSLLASALATQAAVTAPAALANAVAMAITSGAATTTGISGLYFLSVMSTSKTILTGAVVAAILAGVFGMLQLSQRHSAEATLTAATQEVQTTSAKLRDSEQTISGLRRENAELLTKLGGKEVSPTSNAIPNRPMKNPAPAVTNNSAPGVDLVMLRLRSVAQPLFARWGIAPEQHDEVLRLFSEPARIKRDAVELARTEFQKGTWSRENDVKLGESTQRAVGETMEKLRELIGPDHLQELMKLGASLGEHELVSRIAGDVAFTAAPLNFPAGQSLVQILQQTRYSPANCQDTPLGGTIVTADEVGAARSLLNEQGLGTLPFVTDATIAKANDVLAPEQLAALRRLQSQQLALIKMAREANAVAGR